VLSVIRGGGGYDDASIVVSACSCHQPRVAFSSRLSGLEDTAEQRDAPITYFAYASRELGRTLAGTGYKPIRGWWAVAMQPCMKLIGFFFQHRVVLVLDLRQGQSSFPEDMAGQRDTPIT
jgi:hypothetical protein